MTTITMTTSDDADDQRPYAVARRVKQSAARSRRRLPLWRGAGRPNILGSKKQRVGSSSNNTTSSTTSNSTTSSSQSSTSSASSSSNTIS